VEVVDAERRHAEARYQRQQWWQIDPDADAHAQWMLSNTYRAHGQRAASSAQSPNDAQPQLCSSSRMIEALLVGLRFAAALGCGLMAGLFFAFSVAVMGALARIQPPEGIATMQSINRVILNPLFLAVFLGTAMLCLLLALTSLWRWNEAGAAYMLAGALFYFVGTFLVTMLFNVPLNNALDAATPASADAARLWADYLSTWTAWNHVRSITSFAAMAALMGGLYLQARG